MFVVVFLLVLIILIVALLIFAKINNQKTQDDVLKYASQYYTSQHTSQ